MSSLSAGTMTGLLTEPYSRGGETLELVLGADAAGFTPVLSYTFAEYKVRYGTAPPQPQYVLYTKVPIPAAGLRLEVHYTFLGADTVAFLDLPGGSFAGISSAVPIPSAADASLRITQFRQIPKPLSGAGADNFGIIAMLGNISKLSWIIGCEKDVIRGTLNDVRLQRHISYAHDSSLDAIGADLRVPRFPPRPYSFDANTIALYHLEGVVASAGSVAEETSRFGLPGHPGVNLAAQSGVAAKFGAGFHLGPGALEIPTHTDFDLPASQSFTVEMFFRADTTVLADPALIAGKGTLNAAGALTTPGWSLMLGSFRGFSNNIRLSLFDGAQTLDLFADNDFGDAQFYHVAGIVDRDSQRARLLVNAEEASRADITALGALTNTVAIRIGGSTSAAQQFAGVVDEIRFSRIARASFDPVLGEGDESYRRRLAIFRRWRVPNPIDLIQMINSEIQIDGDPNSFVLIEQTLPSELASAIVRILPAKLAAGQSIASDGNMLAKEIDVSGLAASDTTFRPIFLLRHNSAAVDYGNVESNRQMQTVTANAVDSLLSLLATASPPILGTLQIHKSYDATITGLHRVGRALRMGHSTLALEQLAVFAHRVGFDYVANTGIEVYASVAAGESLRIIIEPRVATEVPLDGSDAFAGHVFNLRVEQSALPAGGLFRWVVIPWGYGRASLQAHPADPSTMRTPIQNRPHVQVSAQTPGRVTIRVEYTLARTTVTGTIDLNITIASLADGTAITADGSATASEIDVVGTPEASINPAYLITPTLAINYGANPNNKLMQVAVETPLKSLVSLLGVNAATLQVVKAFDPADTAYFRLGRAIRLTHSTLDIGLLGALAHQAGFDFVSRTGAEIYGSVADGEKIQIANATDLSPVGQELVTGVPVLLKARFTTLPASGTYNWNVAGIGNGNGGFDFALRPSVRFTPSQAGLVELNLTYQQIDPTSVNPYTFEIRLNDTLNVPATIIPKGQYDLLMNILNYFHPIGIEIVTRQIREHVVEVRENLLNAFPGYTFPDFRV